MPLAMTGNFTGVMSTTAAPARNGLSAAKSGAAASRSVEMQVKSSAIGFIRMSFIMLGR